MSHSPSLSGPTYTFSSSGGEGEEGELSVLGTLMGALRWEPKRGNEGQGWGLLGRNKGREDKRGGGETRETAEPIQGGTLGGDILLGEAW